ncbi:MULTISPECIES: MBL fold metallo-hydrolase [unclassified Sphingobium]|uniref:MBL fold metallo-hydrolase n=1 Tax=unclassified Sphingobium TaxID=2611147 RepID=UPI002224AD38|nr:MULTISPECIES: MBL fold metallo-hydrolase [unclassified Sphingobium]MCW2395751.1 metallo-beta-lactamase class B [Sphingobium sp. B8D3B]MCW2419266.1 metallo-beta-lactamase class B [Sphingobium sp. B8D3C]
MANRFVVAGTMTTLALLLATPILAQVDPSDYPRQATFANEHKPDVAKHLSRARRIAGEDLAADMRWRCLISPLDPEQVRGVQHDGLVPATRIYDNLYSIGQNAVSAYALDTPDGIIIIDALNNAAEARDILIPNLKALGLDPSRIKYVVITHGHGDHYGGAKYMQEEFGAKVLASAADWEMILHPDPLSPFAKLAPPRKDRTVQDGETLSLGGTDLRFYVTPGHTPGTLSMIFPVYEGKTRHLAGLMGGTGGGRTADTARQQIASLKRWRSLTAAAGVDVLITNHPAHSSATEKQALIRYAMPGDVNPFTTGRQRYQRYMQVMEECSRVQLARMGAAAD